MGRPSPARWTDAAVAHCRRRATAMPANRNHRRAALVQAVGCVAVAALGGAPARAPRRRVVPAEILRLPVGELRSQAAELHLLRRRLADGSVVPRFARAHAGHLRRAVAASIDDLAGLRVDARHADAKAQALALAEALRQAVLQFEGAPAAAPDAAPLAPRLRALDDGLA